MPRGRGAPGTALFIKEYMDKNGEASISDIYKEIKKKYSNYRTPSIHGVATMFYLLKRLGLIEKVREYINENNRREAKYVLNPDKVDSEEWRSPYVYAYPHDYDYIYLKKKVKLPIGTKKKRRKK